MASTHLRPAPPARGRPAADAANLERIAWLMDRAITIPGTNISVGLDAILGLLPVGGDVLTGLVQVGLVLYAVSQYQVPRAVAGRMVANVLLDIGVGSIPLVGDIFDVFFKANTRNMALLRQIHAEESRGRVISSTSSVRYLLGIGALLGAALLVVLIGFVALVVWIVRQPLF